MADTPTAAEIEKYILDALALIWRRALFSGDVDWDAVQREAREAAARAKGYAGTHRLLHRVLKQAGGQHSHFVAPYMRSRATGSEMVARDRAAAGPPIPSGELLDGVGYLVLPTTRAGRYGRRGSAAGLAVVDRLARARPAGWIVDLRDNQGGNMWPMLAAVAGLLRPGVVGCFMRPGGGIQPWRVNRWCVSCGYRPMARRAGHGFRRGDAPIAVLTSQRTASAAEAVLVALRAQDRVRTIGTATAGMTTGNAGHLLPDGTMLRISEAYYADARRQLVTGVIEPDQVVDADNQQAAMTAAREWIAGMTPTRP